MREQSWPVGVTFFPKGESSKMMPTKWLSFIFLFFFAFFKKRNKYFLCVKVHLDEIGEFRFWSHYKHTVFLFWPALLYLQIHTHVHTNTHAWALNFMIVCIGNKTQQKETRKKKIVKSRVLQKTAKDLMAQKWPAKRNGTQ